MIWLQSSSKKMQSYIKIFFFKFYYCAQSKKIVPSVWEHQIKFSLSKEPQMKKFKADPF